MNISLDDSINFFFLDSQRIPIRNRLIVKIFVDVITEFKIGTFFLGEQRSSGQCHKNRIRVAEYQILKVGAFQCIRTVCLVNKEDSLNVGIVGVSSLRNSLFKLLNINDNELSNCVGLSGMRKHLIQFLTETGLGLCINHIKVAV